MKKGIQRYIIFTGANERAVIAACRYFRKSGIEFSLIGRPGKDKIRYTKYKSELHAIRNMDYLDIQDMANCISVIKNLFKDDELIYLPTAESVNRVIMSERKMFDLAGLRCHLPDEETYNIISDKSKFIDLTQKYGVMSPLTIVNPVESDIPFVAKPQNEFSNLTGIKLYPELIMTKEIFNEFGSNPNLKEYFFQKYIDGESYYYLFSFMSDKTYVARYQRNLMQQSGGKSIVAAVACSCPDKIFEKNIVTALESINFQGLVMVEMMMKDEMSWLIEANPRLWGPFQLAIQQGITPSLFTQGNHYEFTQGTKVNYLWFGGIIGDWSRKKSLRYYLRKNESMWKFILSSIRSDVYLHRDTIHLFIYELKNSLKGIFGFNKKARGK